MLVLCRLSSSTTLFGSRDATLCTGRESTGHGLIVSHYSTPTPLRSALTLRLGDGRHGGEPKHSERDHSARDPPPKVGAVRSQCVRDCGIVRSERPLCSRPGAGLSRPTWTFIPKNEGK